MARDHHWIVARTKPNREMWAAENISKQGYEFYFPKILVQRRRIIQMQPLFACYIFVHTPGPWRFLLGTFGVAGVITVADGPALVANRTIEELKAKEFDGCVELPKNDKERWKVGQQLRVNGGMFSGCYGVYDGMDVKQRERVLLDFLGRKTPVLLGPELLEAA
jgi:transcription antitermination factor NusG